MSVKSINHYSMENPASVYDEEALTALELAARTAGKVNECVKAFNDHEVHTKEVITQFQDDTNEDIAQFKQDTNADITQFKKDTNADITQFKKDTNDDIARFKQTVYNNMEEQDQEIEDAVVYMKGNIRQTTADELADMKKTGELDHIIEGSVFTDFSHRTENMVTPEMFGAKGDGVTDDSSAFQQAVNTGKTVYLGNKVYVLNETINLPVGVEITGSKNSIVYAYAPTVFHITEKNTISGFTIRVKSVNVLNVFEADDNSGGTNMSGDGALLFTTISNMTVYRDVATDTPMYTVFHFHVNENAFYDIKVSGCTLVNNGTCGYATRVYSNGTGWLSTCSFIDCNTTGFVWHYFFAENDKSLVNNSGGYHTVTNCVGQCTPQTNGFLFVNGPNNARVTKCMAWDWGSTTTGSINCRAKPYVINANYIDDSLNANNSLFNDIDVNNIIFYDGTSFTTSNYDHTHMVYFGGKYNPHLIPKYIHIPMKPCFTLGPVDSSNASMRQRFYLCDAYGITYVSIIPAKGEVYLSQPLLDSCMFGISPDGKTTYMYNPDGNLPANLGIMTLPISNVLVGYGDGNTKNTEKTPNSWTRMDNAVLNSVPADIVPLTKKLANPSFVTDDKGLIYMLKVVKDENNKSVLDISRVWCGTKET